MGETSVALSEILSMVAKINELVSGISSASKEQSTGVREIHSAMDQLDEVTQKNAAMVEEMTAASHNLKADSLALSDVVSKFGDANAAATSPEKTAKALTTECAVAPRAAVAVGAAAKAVSPDVDVGWEEF